MDVTENEFGRAQGWCHAVTASYQEFWRSTDESNRGWCGRDDDRARFHLASAWTRARNVSICAPRTNQTTINQDGSHRSDGSSYIPFTPQGQFTKATQRVFHQMDAASGVEALVMPTM